MQLRKMNVFVNSNVKDEIRNVNFYQVKLTKIMKIEANQINDKLKDLSSNKFIKWSSPDLVFNLKIF